MTVTEVVHFTLKPGTDVTTVGAEGNQIVDHVLETIMKQDGCLSLAHGATIENHEDLDMIVGTCCLCFQWK